MQLDSATPIRKRWRLRTRFAAGLAVLFLAIFGLIAYSHFQYLTDKRDARMEDMQRVSQTVAASFDGLTHDMEGFTRTTAITLGDANLPISADVSESTRETINTYLQHLFESHGLLRAIFVTDTAGQVIFDNGGNSFGTDLSDRPYIQALQAGEDAHWSDGFPGSETGQMVVAHSRVITSAEGQTTGYLVVAMLTESLAARLPADLAGSGHISIVDNEGKIVLRFPDDNPEAQPGVSVADWPAYLAASSGGALQIRNETLPIAPRDRYGALTSIENLGWVVGFTLPASEIEGSTTGLFLRDMALLGAIILAAFIAMWMFANQTVEPLTRLTEVAASISKGHGADQPVRVESGNAEVSLLANTMEQMRTSMVQREAQLRDQANVIGALERFGESVATELDLDRAVAAITESGAELLNADAAQIVLRVEDGRPHPVAVAGPHTSLALPEDDPLIARVLADEVVEIGDRDPGNTESGPGAGGPGARSVLGVPVHLQNGDVEGALLLLRADAHAFTNYHRGLAEGLARWACIVLENARLYARSQELIVELEESNAAKNDFLGIVSHELRTPITTIYGGTLLLRLRRESLPEQAFNDMIVSISEEAERLHHLVQDLLTIARTELATEARPIHLQEVLQTTITDFAATHRRTIDVNVEPGLPPAMGDSTYIRQVMTNLISNADKYTPLEQPIEIDITHEDEDIIVCVRDHGDGIAEAELPRVFDSFYRSKEAVERASGSGLGLTVCKRLVETLGGTIWAQNRPEGGLEVGFTLKAAEVPPLDDDTRHTAAALPAEAGNARRVRGSGEA